MTRSTRDARGRTRKNIVTTKGRSHVIQSQSPDNSMAKERRQVDGKEFGHHMADCGVGCVRRGPRSATSIFSPSISSFVADKETSTGRRTTGPPCLQEGIGIVQIHEDGWLRCPCMQDESGTGGTCFKKKKNTTRVGNIREKKCSPPDMANRPFDVFAVHVDRRNAVITPSISYMRRMVMEPGRTRGAGIETSGRVVSIGFCCRSSCKDVYSHLKACPRPLDVHRCRRSSGQNRGYPVGMYVPGFISLD